MYHKWQSYNASFLTYEAWQTEFLLILGHFLPFYPTNNPKNQNFKKTKKAHGDIIILHKCTKNHDHMLYCSWDMAWDVYNYFSFCPFTLLRTQKVKIKKKNERNTWRYHHFTQVFQKSWSYATLFLRYDAWCMKLFFSILGQFLPFNILKNQKKILKNEKNTWRHNDFTHAPKIMIRWCTTPEIWRAMDGQTDGQIDGWRERQKKWHGCPT